MAHQPFADLAQAIARAGEESEIAARRMSELQRLQTQADERALKKLRKAAKRASISGD